MEIEISFWGVCAVIYIWSALFMVYGDRVSFIPFSYNLYSSRSITEPLWPHWASSVGLRSIWVFLLSEILEFFEVLDQGVDTWEIVLDAIVLMLDTAHEWWTVR